MPQTAFVSTETFTQDEFEEWLTELPQEDTNRYELLHGSIVTSPPATWPHGNTGARIVRELGNCAAQYQLGSDSLLENSRYGALLLFRTDGTLTSVILSRLQLPVHNLFA